MADTKPKHRAVYSADKKTGGWNVRVSGPQANKFAGHDVPVTIKDGSIHNEKLVRLLWSGPDKDMDTGMPTGNLAALYSFEPKPKQEKAKADF